MQAFLTQMLNAQSPEAVAYFVLESVVVAQALLIAAVPLEEDLDEPEAMDRYESEKQEALRRIERILEEWHAQNGRRDGDSIQ